MESLSLINGSLAASKDKSAGVLAKRAENLAKNFSDEVESASEEMKAEHKSDYEKAVEKRKAKLMDACVEAESLFVSQMLKQMRSSVQKGEMFHGGQTEEIFEDMLYDKYALNISKTANLGIAKMMYEQLSKGV